MSAVTMSGATLPAITRALKNLSAILTKAEAWCTSTSTPQSTLIGGRLAPDMHALPFQVIVATTSARNVLLGPSWVYQTSGSRDDDDTDFAGMKARIERALKNVEAADREVMDVACGERIECWPSGTKGVGAHFEFETGAEMIEQFLMPNFWFHVTTAYAILRSKGVPLGKLDFIAGGMPLSTK